MLVIWYLVYRDWQNWYACSRLLQFKFQEKNIEKETLIGGSVVEKKLLIQKRIAD